MISLLVAQNGSLFENAPWNTNPAKVHGNMVTREAMVRYHVVNRRVLIRTLFHRLCNSTLSFYVIVWSMASVAGRTIRSQRRVGQQPPVPSRPFVRSPRIFVWGSQALGQTSQDEYCTSTESMLGRCSRCIYATIGNPAVSSVKTVAEGWKNACNHRSGVSAHPGGWTSPITASNPVSTPASMPCACFGRPWR